MDLTSFLPNIVSSLVAGFILLFGTPFLSRRAKRFFTAVAARLLGLDIETIFGDKEEATPDIQRELLRARRIRILTGRGSEFQRSTFDSVFASNDSHHQKRVQILLPATGTEEIPNYWTEQREAELAVFDRAFGEGFLRKQIDNNVEHLRKHTEAGIAEFRRFDSPHQGRIVLTERYAYFTPYRADSHGRRSVIYKFIRGGEMYENLSRLFDQLWEASYESDPRA